MTEHNRRFHGRFGVWDFNGIDCETAAVMDIPIRRPCFSFRTRGRQTFQPCLTWGTSVRRRNRANRPTILLLNPLMVPGTGLEPAHLSATASKTVVSAIPPPGRGSSAENLGWRPERRKRAIAATARAQRASIVAGNVGSRRARVRPSKSAAKASNRASLHARPKNDSPSGRPFTSAAGRVTLG